MTLSTKITYLKLPPFTRNQVFNDQIGHNWQDNIMAQSAKVPSLNAKGCGFESY